MDPKTLRRIMLLPAYYKGKTEEFNNSEYCEKINRILKVIKLVINPREKDINIINKFIDIMILNEEIKALNILIRQKYFIHEITDDTHELEIKRVQAILDFIKNPRPLYEPTFIFEERKINKEISIDSYIRTDIASFKCYIDPNKMTICGNMILSNDFEGVWFELEGG
jgi:hypothetical protein